MSALALKDERSLSPIDIPVVFTPRRIHPGCGYWGVKTTEIHLGQLGLTTVRTGGVRAGGRRQEAGDRKLSQEARDRGKRQEARG